MARRIVPELISPSQAAAVQPAFKSIAEQPLNLRFDLKEQAELAKTMLEPGRKIYVDISDDSKVNWRKLQRAAGVQKTKPQQKAAPAMPLPTDKAQPFQVPVGRGGGSNIFASVVERLEAGLAMPHGSDSEDSSSEPEERPANPDPNSEGDSEGGNDEYAEYDDEFIDDSEFHEYYGGDWHKPKHSGFYINQGDIEKTDELLMSDEPDKPEPRKRRIKPKQAKAGATAKSPVQAGVVRQVMGKDGKLKRRRVNPDGMAAGRKTTRGIGEAPAAARDPKHVSRPVSAAAAALAMPPAAAQGQADSAAGLLSPPQPALPNNNVQPGPGAQVALTPEEDRIPLAMMAGVTPAKPPRALTESLPVSPAAGPPGPQVPALVRTPQTGKKRSREGNEGGGGYEIPADVHALLDQLRALAEDLGLPQEGKEAVEEPPTQPGEEKPQKKLPPQLNPLLAKLARTAARENDKSSGARTTIANAAYSFLHPWTQKGNMAVRLKKLHDSALARYDKSKDWLVNTVAQQQPVLTGVADDGPNPIGSDDDFAALPAHAPSQQATAAAAANPAAGGGATAAAGSGLVWNKNQEYALHDYVTSLMDLQGGHDDNPRLWEDVAAKSDLWGPNRVSAAELREVYLRNKTIYSQADGEGQPRKRPRKARPLSGGVDTTRASGILDEALGRKFVALDPVQSQPPSETPSLSPQALPASPVQPVIAPAPALASGPLASGPYPQPPPAIHAASIQPPVAERRPQLWPSAGGPLPAVPQPSGQEVMSIVGQTAPANSQPAGALQASQAGPLVAQPSDGLSQMAPPSQAETGPVPTPPSKEEFLQFGVNHGGDRESLARGLSTCREGTIKDITYKVLLHAGPEGLKVSKVAESAKAMGLVASDWVSNRNSRSSQISNAIRNTDMFTHVGDHRYAIAAFPGAQHVPLKPTQGKRSGEKATVAEDIEMAPSTATPLEGYDSSLAAANSAPVLDSHNRGASGMTSVGSMSTAPNMAPMLPAQAQLMQHAGPMPAVLVAALNQIGQGQPSLQSLLHADTDEAEQQPAPNLLPHPQNPAM